MHLRRMVGLVLGVGGLVGLLKMGCLIVLLVGWSCSARRPLKNVMVMKTCLMVYGIVGGSLLMLMLMAIMRVCCQSSYCLGGSDLRKTCYYVMFLS